MIETIKLFELAQLAEASYANLIAGKSLSDELQNSNFNGMAFSDTQASEFVNHWRVIHHQPDTALGFSATLFERIDNDPQSGFQQGQLVYAIRGTAGPTDLFSADGGAIIGDRPRFIASSPAH